MSKESRRDRRILIVDDEPDITTVMKKGLQEYAGYDVTTFNDPGQALAEFKPDTYDLLVIDIKMPGMTGFELYKKLRNIDSKPKICFITAFEMYYAEFRKVFPSLDVKCFIRKPVTISSLIQQVDAEFASPPRPETR
ncbi:MAG TPA: response regulator [Nitrososphaera sp.]|jgi:DNA-binding response OmpR family regulator|nr:response regulator [Nitrososphaera sp.]